jgi:hypothetical protein
MTLRGTAEDVDGAEVWVLIRPENGDYSTTNQRALDVIEGEWRLEIHLGTDSADDDVEYVITALALKASEAEVLKDALKDTDGETPASFTVDELFDDFQMAVARDDVRVALSAPVEAAPPPPSVSIHSPMEENVDSPLTVTGTAVLPPETALWLLLKPEGDPVHYVTTDSEIAVDQLGHWDSRLDLGRGPCDKGRRYLLYVLAAPRGGVIDEEMDRRLPDQYSVRLSAIPTDSTQLAAIRMTLRDYRGERHC